LPWTGEKKPRVTRGLTLKSVSPSGSSLNEREDRSGAAVGHRPGHFAKDRGKKRNKKEAIGNLRNKMKEDKYIVTEK